LASPVKATVYAFFTGDATLSYNGSGTFQINTTGQPVVAGTVISSTAFNALTADLANGLSTAITKDGQTTVTANIPMSNFKITGLGAATVGTDAARYSQIQGGTDKLITVTGTDTLTGSMTPALTAYAAGNQFSFVPVNTNTGAVTINIDGVGSKAITRTGSTALVAGDMVAGQVALIEYDGTRFQLLNGNSFTNLNVSGNETIGGTLTYGGVTLTGAVTGTGKMMLDTSPTVNNPTVTNYVESVVAIGTVTSSNTIALTNGTVQTATLTASTACTFTMPTATAGKSFVLLLKQAASTGNGTATFTGVKWGTAGAPTITATAGKMDILTFIADGTNWYGSIAQGYTP
jgi:hypothetical protein